MTDISGHRFGKLLAVKVSHKILRNFYWLCVCDCGQTKSIRFYSLVNGVTKSCGCISRELSRKRLKGKKYAETHGMSDKLIYRAWQGMLERCSNKNHKSYSDYGGRGIKVCERWLSFENFYEDMGNRPEGMSLDRINNDGNYEIGNCKWSTRSEQMKNRRPRIKMEA